jgi:membrane protease subunit HflC
MVDFFAKWRIDDVALFYRSFGIDERNAQARLAQIIRDKMQTQFRERTIQEAVSGERGEIMDVLRVQINRIVQAYGLEVLDVRISRIDLPDEVSESVYDRMRTERQLAAKEIRAEGREEATRVRAAADREHTVILAQAYRDSQRIRGAGDAKAAEIYARAYGGDPEFYKFYRSLNAYKNSFNGKSDMLIVDPRGEFFRYFNDADGSGSDAVSRAGSEQRLK